MLEHKIKFFLGKSVVGAAAVLGLAGCGDNVTNNYYNLPPKDATVNVGGQNEDTINIKPETISFYDTEFKVDTITSPEIGNGNDVPQDTLIYESTPIDAFNDTLKTILGCTDSKAENYNPDATKSDGSCIYYQPPACGGDLADYPNMFVTDGTFNGYLVVGEDAPAIDSLSMIDIAAGMKYKNAEGAWTPVAIVDATKLDSEVVDYKAQNLITVGSPCVNTVSAAVVGNPAECTTGLESGKGLIKLFKQDTGFYSLLVAGYSGDDTRAAAKFLMKKWYELEGCEVVVETATPIVTTCLDGAIEKIECETDSPCKGYKTRECIGGKWGEWGSCEDIKLIGQGVMPRASDSKVAFVKVTFANDYATPYPVEVYDLTTNKTTTIYNLNEDVKFGITNFELNNSTVLVNKTSGSVTKVILIDILSKNILYEAVTDSEFGCSDFEDNTLVCLGADKEVYTIDALTGIETQTSIKTKMSATWSEATIELHNLQIQDGTIAIPEVEGECGGECSSFGIYNSSGDIAEIGGIYPLLSSNSVVYSVKEESTLSTEWLSLPDWKVSHLKEVFDLNCITTKRYHSGLEGYILVCPVDTSDSMNSNPLYVINLETKQAQLVSDKSTIYSYVSLSGINLVFTIPTEKAIVDNPNYAPDPNYITSPIYLCELKDEWVN